MIRRILETFRGDTYRARAFRGTVSVGILMGGQNVIRLAGNLVLTRLLFPEAFGLMALVMVVLLAATMFSDVGINPAILQHERGHDPTFLDTAWTVQIMRGTILCLGILLLAGPLARFYGSPELADLLHVSAFIPLIQGFNSTRLATARREIQLERVVALELGAQLLGVLAMIALSFWLRSVWGLVLGTLVRPAMVASLSHVVLSGHRNRLALEPEALRALSGFGKYIFFATIAGYFVTQGDRAVLGRYVALDELAIYNIGFFLATVPKLLAQAVSDSVIFPLYARRPPAESRENRRKINAARMSLTAAMVAAAAAMALLGDLLVRVLYDPRYEAGGAVLVAIALGTLPQIVLLTYNFLPLAYGHSGRYATVVILRAAVFMGVLLLTVPRFGIWAAALAPAMEAILIYPVLIWSIRPYKAWDPRHDLIFAAAVAVVFAVVLRVHGDIFATVLASF